MIKVGSFNVDLNKLKNFYADPKNFITCIPNTKDIQGNKFKLDATVGAMSFTVDGELEQKVSGNDYTSIVKIFGPGVTITIDSKLTVENSTASITTDYKAEGPAVAIVGGLLDSTISALATQTAECIKRKIS